MKTLDCRFGKLSTIINIASMKLLIELWLVIFKIVFLLFFSLRLANALEHLVKMRGERQIQGKCSDMHRNAHNTSIDNISINKRKCFFSSLKMYLTLRQWVPSHYDSTFVLSRRKYSHKKVVNH